MLCVAFIGYYLSDPEVTIKPNSNGAGVVGNLVEGSFWAGAAFVGGTLWQPVLNGFCSADELSKAISPECMAKVGELTGPSFATTLVCIKALMTVAEYCLKGKSEYFRSFNLKNTIADSLLFGVIICGFADAAFVLAALNNSFNLPSYSNATDFEFQATVMQMGSNAMTMMIGGLVGYLLRGGIKLPFDVHENWGNLQGSFQKYMKEISLNSQCTIF